MSSNPSSNLSSKAPLKAEEGRRPRRRRRLSALLLVLAALVLVFWELGAVVAALNHLASVLARGEAARSLAAAGGRVAIEQVRSALAALGHWLIRVAGR